MKSKILALIIFCIYLIMAWARFGTEKIGLPLLVFTFPLICILRPDIVNMIPSKFGRRTLKLFGTTIEKSKAPEWMVSVGGWVVLLLPLLYLIYSVVRK